MTVEFGLLGEVWASRESRTLDVGTARQRCVLAALLADAGRMVTADRLIDRVWGEDLPPTARRTLSSYLTRLRTAGVPIERRPGGYRLAADPDSVDVHRFARIVAEARAAREDDDAHRLLGEALALWRGEALSGMDTPWAREARAAWHGQRFEAELDHIELGLRLHKGGEVLPVVRDLAAAHPSDERVAGQLMTALHQVGRTAEALSVYRDFRADLVEQLGVEPGPSLQAVHQRILAGSPEASVPRQLPAAPSWFTGRTSELAVLDHVTGPAVISGSGGVGKSTLALRWAWQNVDRFPDGQLFVNLRGFDPSARPVAVTTALRGFLLALGVDNASIPSDADEQSALFRTLTADRQMLLILDNAADYAQVTPLLPSGGSTTIITSRHRLTALVTTHGATPVPLDTLPDSDARALLSARIGAGRVAAEPGATNDLVAQCAGLPLALSIVAGRAQARPAFPLAVFATQLQDVATRLGELDDEDPVAGVRAVLSWSTAALTDEQRRTFTLLGIAPGPDIGVRSAACLADLTLQQARTVLRALERVSLLQEHQAERYRMCDLVRLHAADLPITAEDREAALHRLVDMHTHTAESSAKLIFPHRRSSALGPVPRNAHTYVPTSRDAAWAWFHTEQLCLDATVRTAAGLGLHTQVWQLAWYLCPLYDRTGFLQEAFGVWSLALSAMHHLDNAAALADTHNALGLKSAQLGNHEEALQHLAKARALAADAGNLQQEALVENTLSLVYEWWGDIEAAMPHAKRSYEIFRQLDNKLFEAQSLGHLGWIAALAGDHHTASQCCEEALEVFEAHDDKDSQCLLVDTLAYTARATMRLTDARDLYRRACELANEAGNLRKEATIAERLGDVLAEIGDLEAARGAWERALRLMRGQHRFTDAKRVEERLAR